MTEPRLLTFRGQGSPVTPLYSIAKWQLPAGRIVVTRLQWWASTSLNYADFAVWAHSRRNATTIGLLGNQVILSGPNNAFVPATLDTQFISLRTHLNPGYSFITMGYNILVNQVINLICTLEYCVIPSAP